MLELNVMLIDCLFKAVFIMHRIFELYESKRYRKNKEIFLMKIAILIILI